MAVSRQISVTLPAQLALEVQARVASGEYVSKGDVIREALRALQARDRAAEQWLLGEVAPAYEACKRNPERLTSLDVLRERLSTRYAKRAEPTDN